MQTPSDNAHTDRSYFKKSDLAIIIVVVVVAVLGILFIQYKKSLQDTSAYNYVAINIDGKDMEYFDLADYTDSTVIDLEPKLGVKAKLELRDHEARLIEVNCPDKLCERAGFVKHEMDSAVCLPNKMMLRVYPRAEVENK